MTADKKSVPASAAQPSTSNQQPATSNQRNAVDQVAPCAGGGRSLAKPVPAARQVRGRTCPSRPSPRHCSTAPTPARRSPRRSWAGSPAFGWWRWRGASTGPTAALAVWCRQASRCSTSKVALDSLAAPAERAQPGPAARRQRRHPHPRCPRHRGRVQRHLCPHAGPAACSGDRHEPAAVGRPPDGGLLRALNQRVAQPPQSLPETRLRRTDGTLLAIEISGYAVTLAERPL